MRMRDIINLCEDHSDEPRPDMSFTLKDGRELVVHSFDDYEESCISVYATVDVETVAEAKFDPDRSYFRGVEVTPQYRRQGVASAIYAYIEAQGFTIRPSNNVQPDGQKFWASRKSS